MKSLYIYDSVQKIKRKFISMQDNKVSLYVCGPTVYDNSHLGHAKSSLVFDLLNRVLKANNYEVIYVRNITDIDDKIIKKALSENKNIKEITNFYSLAFNEEMKKIGVLPPDIEPKATQNLEAMFEMITRLLKNKNAYKTQNGDIYFDTSSDDKYLTLSKRVQNADERQERVQSSKEKRNQEDFALWKSIKDKSVSFDSPFGNGRPGWHLECSAMIEKHLAKKDASFAVDIHGGGADLLFPHHENEAAQTRCSSNHELANYWMHNGFVNIDGEKMSKSLGNSFFLKDALEKYDGEVLRFYLLSIHYRSNFNFNEEKLQNTKKRLDKIYRLKKRLFGLTKNSLDTNFKTELLEALNDDINISKALALIDEMISKTNDILDTKGKHKTLKQETISNLLFIENILGFGVKNPFEYFQFGLSADVKMQINSLIKKRNIAKREKNFELSDKIRDEILNLNVSIMDTPSGTFWEKI